MFEEMSNDDSNQRHKRILSEIKGTDISSARLIQYLRNILLHYVTIEARPSA